MDQQQLDFPDAEPPRRRRRRDSGKPKPNPHRPQPPAEDVPLLQTPILQLCGFCGHGQTVLGETALCDECGGIMVREEADDDE